MNAATIAWRSNHGDVTYNGGAFLVSGTPVLEHNIAEKVKKLSHKALKTAAETGHLKIDKNKLGNFTVSYSPGLKGMACTAGKVISCLAVASAIASGGGTLLLGLASYVGLGGPIAIIGSHANGNKPDSELTEAEKAERERIAKGKEELEKSRWTDPYYSD